MLSCLVVKYAALVAKFIAQQFDGEIGVNVEKGAKDANLLSFTRV